MPKPLSKSTFPANYRPNMADAIRYINLFYSDRINGPHDSALKSLFKKSKTFTPNNRFETVLLKVSTLNDFFSTNIYDTFSVAHHIFSIPDLDRRLAKGDVSVVDDIRYVTHTGSDGFSKKIDHYSFASKFCNWHNGDAFPVYDSYVAAVLNALRVNNDGLFKFKKANDLKCYNVFKAALDTVRNAFGLQSLDYTQLDRYLWKLGKEYF